MPYPDIVDVAYYLCSLEFCVFDRPTFIRLVLLAQKLMAKMYLAITREHKM